MWDGRLTDMTYLVHDHAPLFTGKFTKILESVGCSTKLIPPKTPEYNGYQTIRFASLASASASITSS